MKVGDRVLICGTFKGTIINISDYREPALKYAVDVDNYKDDLVFVSEQALEVIE